MTPSPDPRPPRSSPAADPLHGPPDTGARRLTDAGALTSGGFPVATVIATCLVVAGAVAQLIDPQVLELLRRDPDALRAGELWRTLSPLLVSSAGWGQIVFNTVTIALMGVLVERRFGTLRWLVLFFGAVAVAEPIAYLTEPHGAGSSLGICGLVGGLIALLLRQAVHPGRPLAAGGEPVRRAGDGLVVPIVVTYYVAGLTGQAAGAVIEPRSGGVVGATVASIVAGAVVVSLARGASRRVCIRVAAGLAVAGTTVLIGLGDTHGVALAAGIVLGWALTRLRCADHVE